MSKYPIPPKNPFGPRRPDGILGGLAGFGALIGLSLLFAVAGDLDHQPEPPDSAAILDQNGKLVWPADADISGIMNRRTAYRTVFDAKYGAGEADKFIAEFCADKEYDCFTPKE